MNSLLRKIRITPGGFLLLSALLFFLDWGPLFAVIGNAVIHEYGHLWMLRRMGVYVRRIELGLCGLNIHCNLSYLPPRAVVLCAAAGPAAGLIGAAAVSALGYVFRREGLFLFAGVGVVLSLFNLLPAGTLDGWRILHAVCPRFAYGARTVTAILVLAAGLWFMREGYGTALAVMGLVLLRRDMGKTERCV